MSRIYLAKFVSWSIDGTCQNGASEAPELHPGVAWYRAASWTGKDTVTAIPFDILRRHHDGSFLWLEAAADIQMAKTRLRQLHANYPGDYFIFDQGSQQIVARSAELDGNDVCGSDIYGS